MMRQRHTIGLGFLLLVITISSVPGYRIERPVTFHRFAKSGQMAALIGVVMRSAWWRSDRRHCAIDHEAN